MQFDKRRGKFVEGDTTIEEGQVEEKIRELQRKLAATLDGHASRLLNNKDSLAQFEENLALSTKDAVIQSTITAAGGKKNIDESSIRFRYYGASGNQLRRRFASIANLAEKISNGELSEAQIRDRVNRLSRSVFPAYNRTTLLRKQSEQNHNEAKRSLQIGIDHCPSCPAHQTKTYVPISDVVPIGHACLCGGYCHCTIKTRFNPKRAIAELQGRISLQDKIQDALDNQDLIDDGPTLEEVERLLLYKIGQKRNDPLGFG